MQVDSTQWVSDTPTVKTRYQLANSGIHLLWASKVEPPNVDDEAVSIEPPGEVIVLPANITYFFRIPEDKNPTDLRKTEVA